MSASWICYTEPQSPFLASQGWLKFVCTCTQKQRGVIIQERQLFIKTRKIYKLGFAFANLPQKWGNYLGEGLGGGDNWEMATKWGKYGTCISKSIFKASNTSNKVSQREREVLWSCLGFENRTTNTLYILYTIKTMTYWRKFNCV